MKRFIQKTSIYLIIALVVHVLLGFLADGSTDDFYERFTTNIQTSLIVGSSRAAQGIQPKALNEVLEGEEFYNFSFTLNNSSFGEIYNKAILEKVDKKSTTGSFILSVEPWAFIVTKMNNPKNKNIDSISILSKMHFLSLDPNYEYLYRYIKRGWGNILVKRMENKILNSQKDKLSAVSGSWTYLHDDGWLEVNTSINTDHFSKKLEKTLQMYRRTLEKSKISKQRIKEFENLIVSLKKYGKVYLVRLPAHPELLVLDDKMMPNFNKEIQEISDSYEIPYFDMTVNADKMIYTDGIHMYKSSGAAISKEIAKKISKIEKKN